MNEKFRARAVLVAPLVATGLLASGCMSSPTYGTDKTAGEQLVGDVTGILALAPKDRNHVEYKPRPELVKPGSTDVLPPPQEGVAVASNEAWPESPEQRRAQIRARATENQDNPHFEPEVINDISVSKNTNSGAHSTVTLDKVGDYHSRASANSRREGEEFKRRLAEQNQGSPSSRKYLSEPPLDYRTPAQTAAVGDVGEDELKKQRRIKKAAQKTGSWRDLVPWL